MKDRGMCMVIKAFNYYVSQHITKVEYNVWELEVSYDSWIIVIKSISLHGIPI